jgi:hypothetical protein
MFGKIFQSREIIVELYNISNKRSVVYRIPIWENLGRLISVRVVKGYLEVEMAVQKIDSGQLPLS